MRKNPGVAALLSFIIPGAGMIYCEHIIRGVVFFALWLYIIRPVFWHLSDGYWWANGIPAAAIWIYTIYKSHQLATIYNKPINDNESKSL